MRDGGKRDAGGLGWWPSAFALVYLVVSILMATQAPFDFHWLSSASAPVFRFTKSDVAQNILLFAPLGFVLGLTGRMPLPVAALAGALLSASVEFAQLSIPGRTSNIVDIITNGLGTVVGWTYAVWFMRSQDVGRRRMVLAVMVLPLCWIIAIREIREPLISFLVLLPVMVALCNWPRNLLHQGVWLAAALLPLLYASREHVLAHVAGLPFTIAMIPIGLAGLLALSTYVFRAGGQLQIGLMVAFIAVMLAVDALWFLAQGADLRWTAHSHLHWAGEAASLVVLAYLLIWVRKAGKA